MSGANNNRKYMVGNSIPNIKGVKSADNNVADNKVLRNVNYGNNSTHPAPPKVTTVDKNCPFTFIL